MPCGARTVGFIRQYFVVVVVIIIISIVLMHHVHPRMTLDLLHRDALGRIQTKHTLDEISSLCVGIS